MKKKNSLLIVKILIIACIATIIGSIYYNLWHYAIMNAITLIILFILKKDLMKYKDFNKDEIVKIEIINECITKAKNYIEVLEQQEKELIKLKLKDEKDNQIK